MKLRKISEKVVRRYSDKDYSPAHILKRCFYRRGKTFIVQRLAGLPYMQAQKEHEHREGYNVYATYFLIMSSIVE